MENVEQNQSKKTKFDRKKVEEVLKNENKFIMDLLSSIDFPKRSEFGEESEDENDESSKFAPPLKGKKKSRAKSLQELQQRLAANITNKKRLTYKEKLIKKGLKNRMKKKNQHEERNAQKKLQRAAKLATQLPNKAEPNEKEESVKNLPEQPVFNKEDKLVFSKIDFANLGKQKKLKREKDPKKLLKKIEEQNKKVEEYKESGDTEKAIQLKEKTAWKNALAKAEGQKVKDDPILLKKSLKKKEQQKRSTKKKWEQRVKNVEKSKKDRQQKRTENIQKKKKEKKTKKLKTAVKRGKVIAGY